MNPAIEKLEKEIVRLRSRSTDESISPEYRRQEYAVEALKLESLKACVEALEKIDKENNEEHYSVRIAVCCKSAMALVNRAMGVSHE